MRRMVTVLVLSVGMCVSVTTLAATSVVSTLKMRYMYVGVYLRLFSVFNSWIFDKSFRSKVMARKSQYANEQLPFATNILARFKYRAYISRYMYLQAAH